MILKFKGHKYFRQRLICSTLSGKGIRIDDIRPDDEAPGLKDYEASLLRVIERICNGCRVEINPTGGKQRCRVPWVLVAEFSKVQGLNAIGFNVLGGQEV